MKEEEAPRRVAQFDRMAAATEGKEGRKNEREIEISLDSAIKFLGTRRYPFGTTRLSIERQTTGKGTKRNKEGEREMADLNSRAATTTTTAWQYSPRPSQLLVEP